MTVPSAWTSNSYSAYTALCADEGWLDTVGFGDDAAAKAAVLAHFDGWDEGLRASSPTPTARSSRGASTPSPSGTRWGRVPGVTLLGDAAHLMSPFAGEGANLAMLDGAELAEAVAAHPGDREAALAAYEEALFPRSAAAASAASLETMFSEKGLERMTEFFTSVRDGAGRRLRPVRRRRPGDGDLM